ncbi:MAG TPA: SDR family oxidoreductase [Candidatus Sumerlaeota bacterium]|nr:SDR family oxidoreductase [Candidatus Sumerlaeota bacterium]HPS00340.1 SDR family oxidoreductase [Candidatus Sumerlaeota bacterium]
MTSSKRILDLFRLDGQVALVTGGGGVLGATFARALAEAGATVHITDIRLEAAEANASALRADGLDAHARALDVLSRESLEAASAEIGPLDILLNGAGGNQKAATTAPDNSFFDLPLDALERVLALNLFGGAILPSQVFGRAMRDKAEGGVILNIASMNALRPLTRIPGYSAAKAAVANFTQWLAVHLAQEYNPKLRVNALAPGFFLTDQNRFLLTDEKTGGLTPRGQTILAHTPMGRFGVPEDLAGATLWLCSPAAAFVTGIVLPVDGGFSACSGV